jgi:hypothetical protein
MSDLVEQIKNNAAERFRAMAAMIELNAEVVFGGAVVIIPPVEGGSPIEILTLDNQADVIQFYATIQARITRNVTELEAKSRSTAAFGQRR